MNFSLNAKSVSTSPCGSNYISVDLTGVDEEEIIIAIGTDATLSILDSDCIVNYVDNHLDPEDIVDTLGADKLLANIDIQTIIDYFGEDELRGQLMLRGLTF